MLQVDLEVNGLMVIQGGREVTWQVEYPLTRTLTSEVPTIIRLAPQDLGGIVPLAMVRMQGGGGRLWKLEACLYADMWALISVDIAHFGAYMPILMQDAQILTQQQAF